ncbi:proline-rich protein 36-like [Balaenoptera ricei]|uniref:proline-rich protein 36-like n=1 Tax=Balaenoptera ricei TaxID=2746895 RepID=UPI0028BDE244|nr:proline-rich protein 36-like [Balaenoptera ricei]
MGAIDSEMGEPSCLTFHFPHFLRVPRSLLSTTCLPAGLPPSSPQPGPPPPSAPPRGLQGCVCVTLAGPLFPLLLCLRLSLPFPPPLSPLPPSFSLSFPPLPLCLSVSLRAASHTRSLSYTHVYTHSLILFSSSFYRLPSILFSLPRSPLPSSPGSSSLPLSSPAPWDSPQGSHPFSLRLLLSRLLPSLSGLSPERFSPPFAPSLLSSSLPVSLFSFSPSCISARGFLSCLPSTFCLVSSSASHRFSTCSLPPPRSSSPLFSLVFQNHLPLPLLLPLLGSQCRLLPLPSVSSSVFSFSCSSPLCPWPPRLSSPLPLFLSSPLFPSSSSFLSDPLPSRPRPVPPHTCLFLVSPLSAPFSRGLPLSLFLPFLCLFSPLSGPLSPPSICPALPLPSSHPSPLLSSLNLSFSSLLFLTLQFLFF